MSGAADAAAQHLDPRTAADGSTVICKSTAVKTRRRWNGLEKDKRPGFSLPVISRPGHSSLWHVWVKNTGRCIPGRGVCVEVCLEEVGERVGAGTRKESKGK